MSGSGRRGRRSRACTSAAERHRSCRPTDIERLLARVRERFDIAPDAEITLEANPGPDERGDPAAWRRAGITRISFGAQSLDDAELRRLGRRHRAADVAAAVAGAREAGIASVNLDLLYDTPDGTLATWTATLAAALELGPDHLSLYALTLDDPDGGGAHGSGRRPPADHVAARVAGANAPGSPRTRTAPRPSTSTPPSVLADAGFRGYEISNWARPGHESRHNLAYWQRRPYEAVGPGAHAFDGAVRRWNAARLEGYVAALTGPRPVLPPGGADVVDGAAATAETLILGLRLDTGVPLAIGQRAAPGRRVRVGSRRRAPRRDRRRPGRPDDARPAPLERAARPAGLVGAVPSRTGFRSSVGPFRATPAPGTWRAGGAVGILSGPLPQVTRDVL